MNLKICLCVIIQIYQKFKWIVFRAKLFIGLHKSKGSFWCVLRQVVDQNQYVFSDLNNYLLSKNYIFKPLKILDNFHNCPQLQ